MGQSLLSSVCASLLLHAAVGAAFLTFSIDSYRSPTIPVEFFQLQLLSVSPAAAQEFAVELVEAETEPTPLTELAQQQTVEESTALQPILETVALPRTSVETAETQQAVETEPPIVTEPSLASIVSIRDTIQDIESEFGADIWTTDCGSSSLVAASEGNEFKDESEQCAQAGARDYSAADRNSVYDGLNRVPEPVSRSRRTVPLLASQRRSIAAQLENNNIAAEISELVMSELNNSVNSYYGNHHRRVQNLESLGRRDPAAVFLKQIFSPDILHWRQAGKMENP